MIKATTIKAKSDMIKATTIKATVMVSVELVRDI